MATNRVKWNGRQVQKQINLTITKKLKLVGEAVKSQIQRNISIGRPASKPGGFPHVDTGRLRNSIFWELRDKNTVIVGTPLKYGLWLEIGRKGFSVGKGKAIPMAPRPYIRPTLDQMRAKIQGLFAV